MNRFTTAQEDEIVELYKELGSYVIAKKFGASPTTIAKVLKARGVPLINKKTRLIPGQLKLCRGCNKMLELNKKNFFTKGKSSTGHIRYTSKCKPCKIKQQQTAINNFKERKIRLRKLAIEEYLNFARKREAVISRMLAYLANHKCDAAYEYDALIETKDLIFKTLSKHAPEVIGL